MVKSLFSLCFTGFIWGELFREVRLGFVIFGVSGGVGSIGNFYSDDLFVSLACWG